MNLNICLKNSEIPEESNSCPGNAVKGKNYLCSARNPEQCMQNPSQKYLTFSHSIVNKWCSIKTYLHVLCRFEIKSFKKGVNKKHRFLTERKSDSALLNYLDFQYYDIDGLVKVIPDTRVSAH